MTMSTVGVRWKSAVFLVALVVSAAVFVTVPIWELAHYKSTLWIVTLPQSWQGGIEGIALAIVLVASQRLPNTRARLAVLFMVSELYLRRHGVDVSIFVDLLFIEMLIALGGSIQRWIGVHQPLTIEIYLRNFFLGLVGWSACAWTLSAVDHGSLNELRALSLILAVVGFSTKPRPFCVFVYNRIATKPLAARYACALLFTWLLVLCAKTDATIGFDPLWYGLRGDRVLLDHGSVYHSLGLASAVHYFPKLYEMLLLPVSGIGSSSIISGISLMMFVLLMATAYALTRRIGINRWDVRFAAVAACATLPAIANPALDPKPDTLAALLLLIGWLNASAFVQSRRLSAAMWSLSALILSTQAKLTAVPFAGIIVLTATWLVLRDRRTLSRESTPERRAAIAVLILAVVVTTFVTARTIVLAGMPTIGPDAFFHLWKSIGFELKPPAGTLQWTFAPNWSDMPSLAVDLLFRPQWLDHILITWTGNIWLWCGFVALVASLLWRAPKPSSTATSTIGKALMLAGLLVMFGFGYLIRGSDGNYFIAAVVPAILLGTGALQRALASLSSTRTLGAICFFAFVAFQATYSFLSSSWIPGTHPLDANFHRSLHDFRQYSRALMEQNGLGVIEHYLRHLKHSARVLDCVEESISMRLPARVESVETMAYSRPDYVESQTAFLDFIVRDKIEFLIVPNGDDEGRCSRFEAVGPAIKTLIGDVSVRAIPDEKYTMYDLSRFVVARTPSVTDQH
jgi:hypothetical protein